MSEIVKSIIFCLCGIIIVAVGIYIAAGWEVIGLGALCILVSIAFIIYDYKKAKKINNK